jgi:hypothetical protein
MIRRTHIRPSRCLRSGLAVGVPLCALAGQTQTDRPDMQPKAAFVSDFARYINQPAMQRANPKASSQLLKLARTPGGRAR